MRGMARWLIRLLKWSVAVLIAVEIFSFLIITGTNYWIYEQLRDGDPVRYDPYALFLTIGYPRPTVHNPPAPQRNRSKILWLFGGSAMAGATPEDDKTIPSFLARFMNEEEPRLSSYVINFGEPGFNSLMETKYLQKALIEHAPRPQIIIFYDGANDCAYFAQNRTPDAHQGYDKVQGLVESYHRSLFGLLKPLNAALYASFTRELYEKIMHGVVPIQADDPALRQFVDTVEQRYDYVNQTAAGCGARFLLIWQPCWWVETGPVAPAVRQREDITVGKHFALRHNFTVINKALMERLQSKTYFLNFQNILCARTEPAYQRDGIHLQNSGRRIVAQGMGRFLKEQLLHTAASGGGNR